MRRAMLRLVVALLLASCAHVPCRPAGSKTCSEDLRAVLQCSETGERRVHARCDHMMPAGLCEEVRGDAWCVDAQE